MPVRRADVDCAGLLRAAWPGYADAPIRQEEVPLSRIQPLSERLRWIRLHRAERLIEAMLAAAIDPFVSLVIHDHAKALPWRVVLPPIAEWHTGSLVLVDGVHRLAAARLLGLETVRLVTVSEVAVPPPATPKSWDELEIVDERLSSAEMMGRFEPGRFRPVARAVGRLHFASSRELDRWLATCSSSRDDRET